jgi:hypothetical protein
VDGTVPSSKNLVAGTVPSTKFLLEGTVPASSHYLQDIINGKYYLYNFYITVMLFVSFYSLSQLVAFTLLQYPRFVHMAAFN